jgi:hypothetical protein
VQKKSDESPAYEPLPEPDPDSYVWWGYYHVYKHGDAQKPAREDRRLALVIVADLIKRTFIDPTESEFNEAVDYATLAVLRALRSNTDLMRDAALMAGVDDFEDGAA